MEQMHVLARVQLRPSGDLDDADYRSALSVLDELVKEWNSVHKLKVDEYGTVVLQRESEPYRELRDLFLKYARGNGKRTPLTWNEIVEGVYAESDLLSAEALVMHISGDAGLGGNTYASVYSVTACPDCGLLKVDKQLRDLVLDLKKVRTDLSTTQNWSEEIVSAKFRDLLERSKITGVEFRPVEHARPSRPVRKAYFQLIVSPVAGELLHPRDYKNCNSCGQRVYLTEFRTEAPDPLTKIKWWGPGPWSEMRFRRASYKGLDLARTAEMFGGPISPSEPSPGFHHLVISQRLHRLLRENELTGFWVQPAHLD